MRRLVVVFTVILAAFSLASCAVENQPGAQAAGSPDNFEELVTALRDSGFAVEPMDSIVQPFFEPKAQVIEIDGGQIQIFEFPSEAEARSAADSISADGGSIGTSMVSWVETPHFFSSGKLIALYVGEQVEVIGALQGLLGPQIAGG